MDKKHILNQALIHLGYRKLNNKIYGKPVGFCILIVELTENSFITKTMFESHAKKEPLIYGSKETILESFNQDKKDLYDAFVIAISYSELEAHIQEAAQIGYRVWDFKAFDDIYEYI